MLTKHEQLVASQYTSELLLGLFNSREREANYPLMIKAVVAKLLAELKEEEKHAN